jgi:hypothetical protein
MTMQKRKYSVVLAVASATALGAITPAWSAPVMTSTAKVAQAASAAETASPLVTDVRYRGRYYRHNNNGAAVAAGIFGAIGAIAASSAYRRNGYYGGGPGYDYGYRGGYRGYYGGPYGGGPGYGYYRGY